MDSVITTLTDEVDTAAAQKVPALPVTLIEDARFELFTAVKIRVEVFWVVRPCNFAVEHRRCRGHDPSVFTLKMEAMWSSEMMVSYRNTSGRHNPEDLYLFTSPSARTNRETLGTAKHRLLPTNLIENMFCARNV